MKIEIIYRGAIEKEIIECSDCFAHTSGGWMCINNDNKRSIGDIFISSSDVRNIKFIEV